VQRLSGTPAAVRAHAPRLGADTAAVLTESLALTPADVAALREDGIV
jgi:crotonobetainyl-CoA:carnitine CoA-transferase CaiB-like acyl-CoA transferase